MKGETIMRVQAYEGFLEGGQIFPLIPLVNVKGRRRVIITVLDEPIEENQPSPPEWLNEFNRLLDESGDEKLRMEDFPRADFTREVLEVKP